MSAPATHPEILKTAAGGFPLHEHHLELGGRTWSILHTGA